MIERAQRREHHEPEELHTPARWPLLAAFVALIAWGGWYYFQASRIAPDAGDSRSAAVPAATARIDGASLYAGNCASCHQADGKGLSGVFPPLKGSSWVLAAKPDLPIAILLHGIQGEIEVNGTKYQGVMPPFGRLSDAEVAALASHVRTSFGNVGSAVTEADVALVRDATTSRSGPWAGGAALREAYPE